MLKTVSLAKAERKRIAERTRSNTTSPVKMKPAKKIFITERAVETDTQEEESSSLDSRNTSKETQCGNTVYRSMVAKKEVSK